MTFFALLKFKKRLVLTRNQRYCRAEFGDETKVRPILILLHNIITDEFSTFLSSKEILDNHVLAHKLNLHVAFRRIQSIR